MITIVGGIKGGGGKTTLATNLCVMRSATCKKVLLVDADEQKTCSDWVEQRKALGIETKWTTIQLMGRFIHSDLSRMVNDYDDVIVDVGGRDTTSQRSALSIADVCLIPFKPKSFDLWTLGKVRAMIYEIQTINPSMKVVAIVNQAECRGRDAQDAINMIKEIEEFICLETAIGNRKIFSNASSEGKGIVEIKKSDPKAESEMKMLYNYLYSS